MLKKIILLALVFASVITIFEGNGRVFTRCEDKVEEEMEDTVVESEGEVLAEDAPEDEKPEESKGSPDADTYIKFIQPDGDGKDLPAGKLVEFLIGFKNNGDRDFILDSLSTSFRYPMDFSYYIQNFSSIVTQRTVKPKHEATIQYAFTPAEAFAGRPLGLAVELMYHYVDGIDFEEAIFNKTVNILDVDEGFDGETFFLYVFLLAFAVLLLLAGHHFLSSFNRRKEETLRKPVVETGTNIKDGIDYDWIPKELLNNYNGSPRQSPRNREKSNQSPRSKTKQSPRPRK